MSKKVPHFPHFLGIGAARAGTTWLSQSLSAHPEVWIPAIKELHYFTRSAKYVGPSQLMDANPVKRLCSREKPYRQYRRIAKKAIASNILRPSLKRLMWDSNYLLHSPNDHWYSTLFSQGYGRVTGEITPRYSILDHDDIQKLKDLIPRLKIIFIMRDPVERAWSLVKYHIKRGKEDLSKLSPDEIKRRAFASIIAEQSDYEAILKRWRAQFSPDQMLELYFDEISEQPEALVRRIQQFLGITVSGLPSGMKGSKVNSSLSSSMPSDLRRDLVEYYYPMVERLADSEGGYFASWLESYQDAFSKKPGSATFIYSTPAAIDSLSP